MGSYVNALNRTCRGQSNFPSEYLGRATMHLADLFYVENEEDCLDTLSNVASRVCLVFGSIIAYVVAIYEWTFTVAVSIPFLLSGQSPFDFALGRLDRSLNFYGEAIWNGPAILRRNYHQIVLQEGGRVLEPDDIYEEYIGELTDEAIAEIDATPELYSLFDEEGEGWKKKFENGDSAVFVRLSNYVIFKEIQSPIQAEGMRLEMLLGLQAQMIALDAEEKAELVRKILGGKETKNDKVQALFNGIGNLGGTILQGALGKTFREAYQRHLPAAGNAAEAFAH